MSKNAIAPYTGGNGGTQISTSHSSNSSVGPATYRASSGELAARGDTDISLYQDTEFELMSPPRHHSYGKRPSYEEIEASCPPLSRKQLAISWLTIILACVLILAAISTCRLAGG